MMEPQTFERRQGNSLWIKIRCRKWADIDTVWTNFNANYWKLVDSAGVDVASTVGQTITRGTAPDMFIKIAPTITAALAVGTYTLVSEIGNPTQDYKEERQDILTIIGPNSILP